MEVFFTLLFNMFPLYILIGLGWIAGRFFHVDRISLGNLCIYIIMPVVTFSYVAQLDFKPSYIALPVIVFALYSFITIAFLKVGQKIYTDNTANLMAICSGASNTGYFGLPLIILLFPEEWVAVYVFALTGGVLYEATIMYYIANRGNFSPAQSLKRVLTFPVLYAVVLASLLNYFDVVLPKQLDPYWAYFKGCYVVLGMMIIGCSLSKVTKLVIGPRFLGFVFFAQFVVWPLLSLMAVWVDRTVLYWFEPEVHKMLLIMSLAPPAAGITAYAATLNLSPEKAATTVLIGTIFALFFIPAVLVLSGLY